MPVAHILSQGNEIVTGQLVDTNSAYLAELLFEMGFRVRGTTTCGDRVEDIVAALRHATAGADLVISTGGLGPTEDDLTALAVSQLAGQVLAQDEDALEQVQAKFRRFAKPMADANRKQALLPENAQVVPNPVGTAPGFRVLHQGTHCVFLPGVPSEMKAMIQATVSPWIQDTWPLSPPLTTTFRVAGVGESDLQERLAELERLDPRIELGFRTYMIENHVKLLVHGSTEGDELEPLFQRARAQVRQILGGDCYEEGDRSLAEVVGGHLRDAGQAVTTAESCTGGLLAGMFTAVPGSSDYFERAYVTYANRAKEEVLSVPAEMLAEHGAVSEPVAKAMAEGARKAAGADWALAITGIAGPTGGTADKPVGLVFVAVAGAERTRVRRLQFFRDRDLNRRLSAHVALEMLRRDLLRSSSR